MISETVRWLTCPVCAERSTVVRAPLPKPSVPESPAEPGSVSVPSVASVVPAVFVGPASPASVAAPASPVATEATDGPTKRDAPLTLSADLSCVRCPRGHSFDIARQGYVSLVTGGNHIAGDTAPMMRARSSFLARGLYGPIARSMIDVASSVGARGFLADLGGGTGYYSSAILDALPRWEGVLFDVSKEAAKTAARIPRLLTATADLRKTIPLRTGCVDLALVVFAPRNVPEISRILSPSGLCVVVTPTTRHLRELRVVRPMLDIPVDKSERLVGQFTEFTCETQLIEYTTAFAPEAAAEVILMGPSAFHLTEAPPLLPCPIDVTISVEVHRFRRMSEAI